jgi:hypothetical protein
MDARVGSRYIHMSEILYIYVVYEVNAEYVPKKGKYSEFYMALVSTFAY